MEKTKKQLFLELLRSKLPDAKGEGKAFLQAHIDKVLPMSLKQFDAYEADLRKAARTSKSIAQFTQVTRAMATSR